MMGGGCAPGGKSLGLDQVSWVLACWCGGGGLGAAPAPAGRLTAAVQSAVLSRLPRKQAAPAVGGNFSLGEITAPF